MVDIRLLDHRAHRMFHRAVGEFIISVLIPDKLEIEIWSAHYGFEER